MNIKNCKLSDLFKNWHVIGLEDIQYRIDAGLPLRIKFGCDPTQPDIHLGHCIVLEKLKQLQEYGHEIIFIIGDFTARIGDPSEKSATRKQMNIDDIITNAQTYQDQVFKILNIDKTKIVFNSEWLERLKLDDMIKILAKITVSQLLQRQDFKNRFNTQQPIGMHELIYPILQAYDSVYLEADLEVGGSDQLFNLTLGRDLQVAFGQKPQAIATCPIIPGTDGVKKMSKSLNNYISVTDKFMFAKLMSISDDLICVYASSLNVPLGNISRATGKELRDLKCKLAYALTERYQGRSIASEQMNDFHHTVNSTQTSQVLTLETHLESLDLAWLMQALKLTPSISQGRRFISQGAVDIDGVKVDNVMKKISVPCVFDCKIGKKVFIKIKLKKNNMD